LGTLVVAHPIRVVGQVRDLNGELHVVTRSNGSSVLSPRFHKD
jgi:hypothetical protein